MDIPSVTFLHAWRTTAGRINGSSQMQSSPYDYWYTPLVERDHHVDFTQMPEEVADIRRMVDELPVQGEAFHMNEPK